MTKPIAFRPEPDVALFLEEHNFQGDLSAVINRYLKAAIYYLYSDENPKISCLCGAAYSALITQCPNCKRPSPLRWW